MMERYFIERYEKNVYTPDGTRGVWFSQFKLYILIHTSWLFVEGVGLCERVEEESETEEEKSKY